MSVRDFIVLSTQEKERLENALMGACVAWSRKWFSQSEVEVSSTITNLYIDTSEEFCNIDWLTANLDQHETLVDARSQDFSSLMSILLPALDITKVGAEVDTSLAEKVVNELMSEALGARLDITQKATKKLNPSQLAGQCLWQVSVGAFQLVTVLPSVLVVELTQRQTKKGPAINVDKGQLIADNRLSVVVKFPKFKAALGFLRELKVGDVLETGVSLDKPLTLSTISDAPLAQCYIGKQANKKAIVLSGKY